MGKVYFVRNCARKHECAYFATLEGDFMRRMQTKMNIVPSPAASATGASGYFVVSVDAGVCLTRLPWKMDTNQQFTEMLVSTGAEKPLRVHVQQHSPGPGETLQRVDH